MDDALKMFLTPAEVEELTGYKRKASQMKWLAMHGYKFLMNGQGNVIVLRAYIEFILGGQDYEKAKRRKKPIEPNWDALNR